MSVDEQLNNLIMARDCIVRLRNTQLTFGARISLISKLGRLIGEYSGYLGAIDVNRARAMFIAFNSSMTSHEYGPLLDRIDAEAMILVKLKVGPQ